MISPRTYRLLAWFLELEPPVDARSDLDIQAEVERHYRWNFAVNMLDVTLFWFGFSFISATTVVPLYISKLTDSALAIGLAAVIAQASWFLPQLLTANAVERLPRRKPVIVRVGFFIERLPLWLLVVSAMVAVRSPQAALVIFLVGYGVRGFGAGLIATSWQDMIARCFPTDRRGRFMGLSLFAGTIMGTLAAVISGRLLDAFPFSTNFVYNFLFAAVFMTLSWFMIAKTREPQIPVSAPRRSGRQFLSELPEIVRRDDNYRRFLVARLLLAFGALGTGFVTVAAVARWQLPDSTVGVYTAALLIGQATATPAFGLLADRFGHKLTLEMGTVAAALAFLIAWLAVAPAWYYLVFALLGASQGSIIVSGILVVMEFSRPEKRPTYVGLTNTIVGVASVLAPLAGAWLASFSYDLLFAASAGVTSLSWALLHFLVREPRRAGVMAR